MTYQSLEAAIVARLTGLAGIEVIALPENDNDFQTPYTDAKVTVAFNSSSFDGSENTEYVAQVETITIQLVIWSRLLRGAKGIYQVIDTVQRKLQGWTPPDCTKVHLSTVKFESHTDDLWSYSMMITTETLKIGQPDAVTEILSTEIKLKDEQGEITIDVTSQLS